MNSPKILVFDLDDTLFDELSYVKSGLRFVADWVSQRRNIDADELYGLMEKALEEDRSNILNKVFLQKNIYSKSFIRKSVQVYRTHPPSIELLNEATACLKRFKEWPKLLVTDGNKTAQYAKVRALKLDNEFLFTYLTNRYGRKNAKPSPHCFMKICEFANVLPSDVVYIADNPTKDFKGIKPLGFKTIRVMTGQHKSIKVTKEENADFEIRDLSYLTEKFLENAWQ